MNFSGKNFQNLYMQKKYFNHIFLQTPDNYTEFLKRIYNKFKNTKGPKTLNELKKFALDEARKATSGMNINSRTKKSESGLSILQVSDVIKVMKALYDIIDPLLIKVNHNFKNERRKYYEDNDKYMEVLRTFEQQKKNLINFTLKSICKVMKLKYTLLQTSIFHYLENKEAEVVKIINSFSKLGKLFALAPKTLSEDDIVEILKTYQDNLQYIISSSQNQDIIKYTLVIINDIIYENYGLEEEQIMAFIENNKLQDSNKEVNNIMQMIKSTITEHINLLFDI
jgi:hypothetical protein